MSVIIRLQNLPWSANALDIRQFFRGLSIPEGGVHIVGGEMGDAFIAFSTDEDARQAMMHDREAINGVQIRLLLSSRAEMQKVIETARQQSLLALKKASGVLSTQNKTAVTTEVTLNKKKPVVPSVPQPPIITASSFQNILSSSTATVTPSFLAYQQQAGFTLIPEPNSTTAPSTKNNNDSDDSDSRNSRHSRDRRRSDSREVRRSKSRSRERSIFRRRRERSRDRSRERDWTNGRRSLRRSSRSRERSRARSRERSRDRSREERSRKNNRDTDRRTPRELTNMEAEVKSKSNLVPWSLTNSYQASYMTIESGQQNPLNKISSLENTNKSVGSISPSVTGVAVSSTFQNYNIANQSLTALNNYSLSSILGTGNSDAFKGFALQNPYTTAQNASVDSHGSISNTTSSSAIPGIYVEKKSDETNVNDITVDSASSLPQEPIAFANVNPYEQMYPNLFAQAAALNSGQKLNAAKQSSVSMATNSPKVEDNGPKEVDPNETNCVKISNMCSRTTYSDLRKFFVGLFIPHNGIKMLNDKHGLRVGIAYVQFSRQSSVTKALCRTNNLLKGRSVIIEAVSEQEFIEAEDSFRPLNQDKAYSHRSNDSDNENSESGPLGNSNTGYSALNPYKKMIQLEPFTVLYIEDIPALATEQDIMKMFSSYSLYDILLIASPENRREFVAHVRFSREEDAKSAYEDRAHHQIGYRRVRIRPGSLTEMENAKEKIRLANEQLMKEEQAAEEEEAKRKLEKLITDHITQEENKLKSIVNVDLTEDANADDENDVGDTEELEVSKNNDGEMDIVENNFDEGDDEENDIRQDGCSIQNQLINKLNANIDPRRPQTPNIPSLFDLDPLNTTNLRIQNRSNSFNDPRLRNMNDRAGSSATTNAIDNNKNTSDIGPNTFNPNLNNQKEINPTGTINSIENNFVILKNCDYNARINDVAQLLLTANLALKHIEPLHNERQLPTGEFIVEFRRSNDAEIAVQRFHNVQFRNRSLRVFPITPQEISDRLGKPFLGYIPGGNGIRVTKGFSIDGIARGNLNLSNNMANINSSLRFGNNGPQNINFNNFRTNNPFGDNGPLMNNNNNTGGRNNKLNNNNKNKFNNGGGNGIPEKFACPGCVLSLENVPYKAQINDILRFFQGFDLTPDDIIRRFNDDGTPTGDARVAFASPEQARSAFETKRRKQIFGRNVFIKII